MDATSKQGRIRLLLIVAGCIGSWSDPAHDEFPTTRETLRAIGRRLSQSWPDAI